MFPFPTPMQLGQSVLDVDKLFATTTNSSAAGTTVPLNFAPNFDWHKLVSIAANHRLLDSLRGDNFLVSNSTNAQATATAGSAPNGIKKNTVASGSENEAIWSFRRAKRFFDVVTYTGNGVDGRQIAHNLGIKPGFIFIKRTESAANWVVYSAEMGTGFVLELNQSAAAAATSSYFLEPTTTTFGLRALNEINADGSQYVAYLFAHDPSPTGVIKCGSYTGTGGSTPIPVNLGWEPQWLLIKNSQNNIDSVLNWLIIDAKRGFGSSLSANSTSAQTTVNSITPSSTGFTPSQNNTINRSGNKYLYMAIRKGKL